VVKTVVPIGRSSTTCPVGGKIVGNMLPTCCRIVGVSSVGDDANMLAVGNMLATMFAKWSLALNILRDIDC